MTLIYQDAVFKLVAQNIVDYFVKYFSTKTSD